MMLLNLRESTADVRSTNLCMHHFAANQKSDARSVDELNNQIGGKNIVLLVRNHMTVRNFAGTFPYDSLPAHENINLRNADTDNRTM